MITRKVMQYICDENVSASLNIFRTSLTAVQEKCWSEKPVKHVLVRLHLGGVRDWELAHMANSALAQKPISISNCFPNSMY